MNDYILMHKNDQVAIVELNNNGIKVNDISRQDLMPFGVVETDNCDIHEQLTAWNGNRCIPIGRPNYKSITEKYNINKTTDWIAKSYMCSLTDCYWFKSSDSIATWEDVNFHQNGFSSNLYRALFFNDDGTIINNFNSPDITTDGAEPKMWAEKDDGFYLLKHSIGKKPITVCKEYIASKLFEKLGVNCVDYKIAQVDDFICCESKCFVESDNEEFVTADDLMRDYGYTMQNVGDLMYKLGFEKEFNEMIVCDYLSGNSDRHSRNFGVLIDSDTRQIKSFAPLFDHGETYMFENIDSLDYYVGETTFGKAIETVSSKYLSIVGNINEADVANILNSVPYMYQSTRDEMFNEFFRRVDHINNLILKQEIDGHGRSF
jgi:hypothetical protein